MNGFELRGIYPQRASAAHSRSEHCRRRAEKKPLAGPMDSLAAGRPWHPAVGGPGAFDDVLARTAQETAGAVFTAVTQGILLAGASVYVHQLYVQSQKKT